MKRIELPLGTTYARAKREASLYLAENLYVNSVRVVVEKDTHKMWIEYTEFPKKVVDKLTKV